MHTHFSKDRIASETHKNTQINALSQSLARAHAVCLSLIHTHNSARTESLATHNSMFRSLSRIRVRVRALLPPFFFLNTHPSAGPESLATHTQTHTHAHTHALSFSVSVCVSLSRALTHIHISRARIANNTRTNTHAHTHSLSLSLSVSLSHTRTHTPRQGHNRK